MVSALHASLHVLYQYPSLPYDPIAIIFDLGGVIIDISPQASMQAFADLTKKPVLQITESIRQAGVFEQYESGLLTDEEFFELLRQTLDSNISSEKLIGAWNALLGNIPVHKVETIQALSKKYRLFLLSNTNKIHYNAVQQILADSTQITSFDSILEGVVLSYEVRMRKPESSIYKHVVDTFGLLPSRTLFIDDHLPNVEAAANFGIGSVHYPIDTGIKDLYGYAF